MTLESKKAVRVIKKVYANSRFYLAVRPASPAYFDKQIATSIAFQSIAQNSKSSSPTNIMIVD
jgi:hypothetical protein